MHLHICSLRRSQLTPTYCWWKRPAAGFAGEPRRILFARTRPPRHFFTPVRQTQVTDRETQAGYWSIARLPWNANGTLTGLLETTNTLRRSHPEENIALSVAAWFSFQQHAVSEPAYIVLIKSSDLKANPIFNWYFSRGECKQNQNVFKHLQLFQIHVL